MQPTVVEAQEKEGCENQAVTRAERRKDLVSGSHPGVMRYLSEDVIPRQQRDQASYERVGQAERLGSPCFDRCTDEVG